ncbi:MAG: hypothetical protein JSU90_01495 [Nitrospiraceae bacterium]|nr:MAG: hypothetical protein JSU90_01495 [Nitrospiraceae bacterium]
MFKNRIIFYVFLVILCPGIIFPVVSIYMVHPSFTTLPIEGFEDQAVNLGVHLAERYFPENEPLSKENIPLISEYADRHMKDFHLMKLKIFSPQGEVIYSTDSKDIGEINQKDYFHDTVAKGRPYTKVVKKDSLSLEEKKVVSDVVETYVPIMSGERFNGALEIYYDITANNRALDRIVFKSWIIHLLMTIAGLVITVVILIQLDRILTKQKKIEQELKVYSEKLKKSNQELQDFAHIASHDLQEPLRKVAAFGERLRMKYGNVLGEQGIDYLERIDSATGRMRNLIQGLLAFSRVTTKAQPFKKVDIGKVITGVLSDLEMRIQDTGGHVEVAQLPIIDADPLQMQQLFQNLIGNALKFHNKDHPPLVRVSAEPSGDNGVHARPGRYYRIIVEDNGIGFDNKYEERIFGVFQRLHGRKEYEGSGIGLSVCKKIAERHGGTISAKSAPGEGAKFIITLPEKQGGGEHHG